MSIAVFSEAQSPAVSPTPVWEETGFPVAGPFQAEFFARMGGPRQVAGLFEFVPDVDFFAKDTQSRFVSVSRGMLDRVGLASEDELLGKTDIAIHPRSVASAIRLDDLQVMRTRKPIVDKVEALYTRSRAKEWFRTTKVPILDAGRQVIGVMGFVRPYFGSGGKSASDPQIQRAVAYIHAHCRRRMNIDDVAAAASYSPRHMNRKFHEIFKMSAQEFIIRTRIQSACDDLLGTSLSISDIAMRNGFYDQSSFTKQFRLHTGETPYAYRRQRAAQELEVPEELVVE